MKRDQVVRYFALLVLLIYSAPPVLLSFWIVFEKDYSSPLYVFMAQLAKPSVVEGLFSLIGPLFGAITIFNNDKFTGWVGVAIVCILGAGSLVTIIGLAFSQESVRISTYEILRNNEFYNLLSKYATNFILLFLVSIGLKKFGEE